MPDISTLIKKATMTQKLQKLKANMLVTLDLAQNEDKQMLLQKEILTQKLIELENDIKNYKHLIQAVLKVKVILKKMVLKII